MVLKSNTNYFDAIVVGSGMSGGWAAKELTENGLKTLVLERGRSITHIKDYPTTHKAKWEFDYRQELSLKTKEEYPKQQSVYAFSESTKHFFVKDNEHPYTNDEDKPFMWRRGYHTGGKSILWARQSYRLSEIDFEANLKDGHGVDWPVRYNDIAPWYDYVEKYIGISGQKEGLRQLPDGEFLPPMAMNCVEEHFRDAVKEKLGHVVTIGRCAHLTVPHNGRGPCQYRNMCETGCPYSGYFSSVSVTIPDAQKTGNLTLKNHAIVHSVIYDKETGKAAGVRVIDENTKETTEYFAKVIFLCASTVATTQIMLNSTSPDFPSGIANTSGVLGHYMMDHFITGNSANVDGFEDGYYDGHRPNGFYIPRFHNVDSEHPSFVRGFGYQGGAFRQSWWRGSLEAGLGGAFKDELMKPGPWSMSFSGFGEILPYYENHMRLNPDEKDQWGMPLVHFSCELKENELQMLKEIHNSAGEMVDAAGFKDFWHEEQPIKWKFGDGIHEMGTARMGRDPKTSVLNKWNACHDVPNLYVTDGSFMTSAGCQNPSLTYMAFTARAANHAIEEMKKGNL